MSEVVPYYVADGHVEPQYVVRNPFPFGLGVIAGNTRGWLALAGGVSRALTLHGGSREEMRQAVFTALEKLGPSGFILALVFCNI